MDSIKGAQVLRDRFGEAAEPPPPPNPRVPDAAPPIFHWLGVKPSSASGLPSSARAV
jgi:hypothetical protein